MNNKAVGRFCYSLEHLGLWLGSTPSHTASPSVNVAVALAAALADNEEQIIAELVEIQGDPVDLGGYYHPDVDKAAEAMCPSQTLNAILAG